MDLHDLKSGQAPSPKRKFLGALLQWIILLVLLFWIFSILWPKQSDSAALPYSTFLDQVRAGNVTQITITGNEIQGDFAQPINWPPASETTAETAQPAYTTFTTVFSDILGDNSLLPLLEEKDVDVNIQQIATPWFAILLSNGLPILLLIIFFIYMGRRMTQQQGGIFSFGRSTTKSRNPGETPEVTFADVAGADEAKSDLQEIVDFLRHPETYLQVGARIPRGVLLVGPPGTGKTLLGRAVAGEASVPFFSLSASEFVEMFVGVGASRVRDLFANARLAAPAIIFIDELDAVGRRRGAGLGAVNDEREQTLNQLLVEMDGFDEQSGIILLAATNRPDVLDPALLRPGRFDRQIVVNLPDQRGREGILRIHTRNLSLSGDVDLTRLARSTVGMSGADLANLCNEAALNTAHSKRDLVRMSDFELALDKIILGGERSLLLNEQDRKVVAYHEAGHAVVAWFMPDADPVNKVTIIPRGRALGVTEQIPREDRYNLSRAYLLTRLTVMLAGRTAEEIVIGDITTGAENDLVEATRLARRMVTRWGMTEVGLSAFDVDETQPFLGYEITQGRPYSESSAAKIDLAIQALLKERHQIANDILLQHREKLDSLAEKLLERETVDESELRSVLGAHAATMDYKPQLVSQEAANLITYEGDTPKLMKNGV